MKLRGDKESGDEISRIISKLTDANDLKGVIDEVDFNDEDKLGRGKEMQDRLSKLAAIFDALDFQANRAEGDALLGDAYEYLMRRFATESGKSKGQFCTPAEVSCILTSVVGMDTAGELRITRERFPWRKSLIRRTTTPTERSRRLQRSRQSPSNGAAAQSGLAGDIPLGEAEK